MSAAATTDGIVPNDGIVINCWSVPRARSTALMYSFAQHRNVTEVNDEPLYAHYCAQLPHKAKTRPYFQKLIEAGETDWSKAINKIMLTPPKKGIRYNKHISKHIFHHDLDYLKKCRNFLLIRDPIHQLASLDEKLPLEIDETAYYETMRVYLQLKQLGQEVIVVDSDVLAADPEGTLKELCKRLDIEFDASMLSWPAGPKPYDGLFAPHWYHTVHKSTGFEPSQTRFVQFPEVARDVFEAVAPIYTTLRKHAIAGHVQANKFKPGFIEDHGMKLPTLPDERNKNILVWVGDRLFPRHQASLSVFDSAVQGGDAVWEGLRIYDGKIFNLQPHVKRLLGSAKAMAFADIPSYDHVCECVFRTLAANGMRDGVHIRMTLSRGEKTTSSMNPKFNVYGSLLVIVPEWKPVGGAATYDNAVGIKLITAANRRNPPQCVDSKIHHNNLINNILPKIQANLAGVEDAIMLDVEGFVSETNATNLFCVRSGVVLTPHGDFCLPGTTRTTCIDIAKVLGYEMIERRISLSEFHSADEVFTTGTMGELTPVVDIDGREIGDGKVGPVTVAIMGEYRRRTQEQGVPLPDFA